MTIGKVGEPESTECFPSTRLESVIDLATEHDLVGDAAGIQLIVGILHDEVTQPSALTPRYGPAVERHLTRLLFHSSAEHFRKRGLACAVLAFDDGDLPAFEEGCHSADPAPGGRIEVSETLHAPPVPFFTKGRLLASGSAYRVGMEPTACAFFLHLRSGRVAESDAASHRRRIVVTRHPSARRRHALITPPVRMAQPEAGDLICRKP